jgi:hypothetical protein
MQGRVLERRRSPQTPGRKPKRVLLQSVNCFHSTGRNVNAKLTVN